MFKRVTYENWVLLILIISFVLVASIFIIGTIRAFSMPKDKRKHLAELPLDEESHPETPTTDSTTLPKQP